MKARARDVALAAAAALVGRDPSFGRVIDSSSDADRFSRACRRRAGCENEEGRVTELKKIWKRVDNDIRLSSDYSPIVCETTRSDPVPATAKNEISILCFAKGRPGQWEAFCADFDLAVQGATFHEVQRSLEDAIRDYVEAAREESGPDRDRLLKRRAPLWLVLKWTSLVLVSAWRHRGGIDGPSATASFPVACAA